MLRMVIHRSMNYQAKASDPSIKVEGLQVCRGSRMVLDGIDLQAASGQVTGLLGPSGSGKTTLMRAIVGTQIVAAGAVTVLGLPAGSAELRRRVAYVTQAPSVYPDLTVRENLIYFARILRVPLQRIPSVIEEVGLGQQADQVAATLSGGERSRSSLASALLALPEVLVLDEPTVGLDPLLRRDLWSIFHRIAGDGATILISTHVMDEAERCDDLVLMRDGKIIATGSPQELRAEAATDTIEDAFLRLAAA
jgi:ABC-2 type transport system ATP-binding protein